MKLKNALMLGGTALVAVSSSALAADLPSRKAAPVEYVKVCDVYGSGFFFIPGTDTCLKVGGYVRVDFDHRPVRNDTVMNGNGVIGADTAQPGLGTAQTTVGFYNRAAIELDARTQTAWGTVQTVMRLRQSTGNGFIDRLGNGTSPSLEAAFVRFAGFTFGQAAQPFSFMSPWAYNTHYWTGWPNGVRQLAYTATFGGGLSATVALTDSHSYSGVSTSGRNASFLLPAANPDPMNPTNGAAVVVGNVRYDQAWGSLQVMAAMQAGGRVAGGNTAVQVGDPETGNNRNGTAIGVGAAFNLPMIAAGDRIELTAVAHNRLINFVSDPTLNTPSAAAYGSAPLGGPAFNFAAGQGWQVGAQFRHFWTATLRSQLYTSYVQHRANERAAGTNTQINAADTARGNAWTLGHALIWTPARGFDIGLEINYIRASWNQAAVNSGYNQARNTRLGGYDTDNFVTKLRIQRNF